MKGLKTYLHSTACSILLIVSLILGTCSLALSQNNSSQKVGQSKVDSLLNLFRQHQKLDSFKVDLQNQLGYEYWIIDPNQSEIYGTQAIELSRILHYTQGLAFANRVVGVAHWARSNFDLAFRFLFVAHDTYLDLQDSLGIANTLLNLGMVYQDQSNYPPAISNYQKALDLFEQLGANSRMATTLSKWASLLVEQGQYNDAYELLSKALNTHIKNNFQYGIAEVNNKLGDLFIRKKDYQSALSYLLQSIEAGAKRLDHVGIAQNYQMIGNIYLKKGDLEQAESYLLRSKEMAESYALKGIQKNVYLNLIQLERKKNKATQALVYYDQYIDIIDSLYNEEKQVQITNIESRYKFLQKEKELEIAQQQLSILQQESKTNNLLKIIFLLAFLLLASIAWQLIRKKNQKISFKDEELRHAASKTEDLKTKIENKEKELTSFTLNFVQKNKLFQEIKADIQSIKKDSKTSTKSKLSKLERLIDSAVHIDEDWEDFRRYFESTHSGLIANLKTRYPELTSNDLKLLALVRLNLSTKEIATMLGISPESAKTARYRLRKKLNMETEMNLFNFLLQIESGDLT